MEIRNSDSSLNQLKEEGKSRISQGNSEFNSEVQIKKIDWNGDIMRF